MNESGRPHVVALCGNLRAESHTRIALLSGLVLATFDASNHSRLPPDDR